MSADLIDEVHSLHAQLTDARARIAELEAESAALSRMRNRAEATANQLTLELEAALEQAKAGAVTVKPLSVEAVVNIIRENLSGPLFQEPDIQADHEKDLVETARLILAALSQPASAEREQVTTGGGTDSTYFGREASGFSFEVSKREAGKAKSLKMASVTGAQPIKFQADVIHITPASAGVTVPADLIDALRNGHQADADGCMVKVARQACEEAADILAAFSQPAQGGEG